jgi:hypothetical protein
MASPAKAPQEFGSPLARLIVESVARDAVKTLFMRHCVEMEVHLDNAAQALLEKEWEQDVVNVLLADDLGCLDAEDVTAENCTVLAVEQKLPSQIADLSATQQRVTEWAKRCFGTQHVFNQRVRALRMLEEALEFAQAVDVPIERCHALTKHVFSRPPGKPEQELAGVGVVLLTCASACGVILEDVLFAEIARIEAKPPEHFTARNQAKCDAGFDAEQPTSIAQADGDSVSHLAEYLEPL